MTSWLVQDIILNNLKAFEDFKGFTRWCNENCPTLHNKSQILKQAGAELGQAQLKLGLDFYSIDLK